MKFSPPLVRGTLVERVKRYTAYIALEDGTVVAAHCPNGGAMLGLCDPGLTCWIGYDASPTRKLDWTWHLVEAPGADGKFVTCGLNTHTPNKLVAEALAAEALPELAGYETVRREVKYGEASRIDFLLTGPDRAACWLEVKNCHLRRGGTLAEFPDCVAARSAKHLRELAAMKALGDRAVVLFTVQREDCDAFSTCRDIDPKFAAALDEAADAGVEVLVYACAMATDEIRIGRRIDWRP